MGEVRAVQESGNVMKNSVDETVGNLSRNTGKSSTVSFSMQLGEIAIRSWRNTQEPQNPKKWTPHYGVQISKPD